METLALGPICLKLRGPLLEIIGSKKNVATNNKWRDDPLCENLQQRRHIQCFRRLLLHKSRRPGKYFFSTVRSLFSSTYTDSKETNQRMFQV